MEVNRIPKEENNDLFKTETVILSFQSEHSLPCTITFGMLKSGFGCMCRAQCDIKIVLDLTIHLSTVFTNHAVYIVAYKVIITMHVKLKIRVRLAVC